MAGTPSAAKPRRRFSPLALAKRDKSGRDA